MKTGRRKGNKEMSTGKKRKRIAGLLLAVAVAVVNLGGCGANGEKETDAGSAGTESEVSSGGMGRYLETELSLPEGVETIYALAKLADGQAAMFAYGGGWGLYRSEDGGESWEKQEADDAKLASVFEGYMTGASISPDGTAAGILVDYEGETPVAAVGILGPDGTAERKELILPETGDETDAYAGLMQKCAFDTAGNLLVQNLNGDLFSVDLETGNCTFLAGDSSIRYFGVAGEQILAVTSDGILLFDSTNGSSLSEDAVLSDMIQADSSLADVLGDFGTALAFARETEENAVFYVNHDGLFCHTQGGSVSEQLINGALNTMGDSTVSFLNLVMLDSEHFLLSIIDASGQNRLLKYSYDAQASAVPETELRVYALEDSSYLRQAVSAYQKNHQDVYVNLEIGMSGEDGVTAEDAIQALNTDILAGDGPDVLILDGMPAYSYIEKGVLADISSLVQEIADSDGVFENVRKAYEKDGAIYQFPAKFYVTLVNGTAEAVAAGASVEKLASYINEGQASLTPQNDETLLKTFFLADSAQWTDEEGKLNENIIRNWLEQLKVIYDAGNWDDTQQYYSYSGGAVTDLLGTLTPVSILTGEGEVSYGSLVDMTELLTLAAADKQNGMTYGLADSDGAKSFVPYMLAGISSSTKQTEAAEDFLRTLFGKECGSVDGNGFPVNRAAYDALCEDAQSRYGDDEGIGISVSADDGISLELNLENLTEAETAELTAILEQADAPACMDRVVWEIVLEQGKAVLSGDTTAEQAASEIMQKGSLYLAE